MPNQPSDEFVEAARAFMNGFWQSPEGQTLLAQVRHAWRGYKRRPAYEALRQRLSDAARKYHRNP